MLVNEWNSNSGVNSYILAHQNGKAPEPQAILVNGLGCESEFGEGSGMERMRIPVATFEVEQVRERSI